MSIFERTLSVNEETGPNWTKIFSMHETKKVLLFNIYKELTQVNEKNKEFDLKMGKSYKQAFHRKRNIKTD